MISETIDKQSTASVNEGVLRMIKYNSGLVKDRVEKLAKMEWDVDSGIRTEFGRYSTFLAYKKSEAKNTHRICCGSVTNRKI